MNSKQVFFCLLLMLSGCSGEYTGSPAAMVRVSSDGRYALSTHYGHTLMLWDIEHRTSKTIHQQVNLYSPYFIADSHDFLWQDARTKQVVVESTEGVVKQRLNPGFDVYEHVMTPDNAIYIAADEKANLHKYTTTVQTVFYKHEGPGGLKGSKLLNMTLVKHQLLTSALGSSDRCTLGCGPNLKAAGFKTTGTYNRALWDNIMLWDINTGRPQRKFLGTMGKTSVALSHDGRYIVAGDEGLGCFIWDTQTGKRLHKAALPGDDECVPMPDDFYELRASHWAKTVAVKFIDEAGHFIRFIESVNYATLYQVHSPDIIGYMPFGQQPRPHTFSVFKSANVIATAPKAKILVMGQSGRGMPRHQGTGIIVYRFNDKTHQLERLWAPKGPKSHWRVVNPDNPWAH